MEFGQFSNSSTSGPIITKNTNCAAKRPRKLVRQGIWVSWPFGINQYLEHPPVEGTI